MLAGTDGTPGDLVETCRKIAYRDGVPYLIADEFQFVTGSESANARVTQMLLSLGYIGLPFLFVANFSLLRRLLHRPEEERQRLLGDPIVLMPDGWQSEDWQQTLATQRAVAPNVFIFDPVKDAQPLHAFSAERKRAIAKLLLFAFRHQHPHGGKVDLEAIRRTYHSTAYATYREETEILVTQSIRKRPDEHRKDLWCPLPLPEDAAGMFLSAAKAAREQQVADAELKSALTTEERQAAEQLKRSMRRTTASGEVLPLRKKKPDVSGETLKQNANWFRDQM